MSFTMLGDLTRRFDRRRGACALIAVKECSHCKTRLAEALALRPDIHEFPVQAIMLSA